ncbi:MAG: hypothetical protein ACI4VU_01305 [Methanobrevibacter sp.]
MKGEKNKPKSLEPLKEENNNLINKIKNFLKPENNKHDLSEIKDLDDFLDEYFNNETNFEKDYYKDINTDFSNFNKNELKTDLKNNELNNINDDLKNKSIYESANNDKFNLKDKFNLRGISNDLNSNNIKNNDLNQRLEKPMKKEKLGKPLVNHFKSKYNKTEYTDKEKAKMGVILFILIFIIIIGGAYYFAIYEPKENELNNEKIAKLNEINRLYKGPLVNAKEANVLEDRISKCHNKLDIDSVDVLRPATAQWKDHHLKKIKENKDIGNRIMLTYTNDSKKNILISEDEAIKLIEDNDGYVLSNIEFKKPDTVAVPIEVSRLQAASGLISTGSKIDIYYINSSDNNLKNNNTGNNPNNEINNSSETNPEISGCKVLAIMRGKDSGSINSKTEKSSSKTVDNSSYTYTTDVEENLKAESLEYSDRETEYILSNYGIKLSDYERESNIGDLDANYLILLEVPREDVRFVLNNMDNLILTIPTKNSPDWMINEIKNNNSN